jgi:hypothetical protein
LLGHVTHVCQFNPGSAPLFNLEYPSAAGGQ